MENLYDVVILGGGFAGLTAAIYSAKSKLSTAVIDFNQYGGQASLTDSIENYPGFEEIAGSELIERLKLQASASGARLISDIIADVDFSEKIKRLSSKKNRYAARSVIIASGATPKKAGFSGEEKFTGRGVSYCATCDAPLYDGKRVFVIGGGNSAATEALYLARFASRVTLAVRRDRLRCSEYLADELLKDKKIELLYNTEITAVDGELNVSEVTLYNRLSGKSEKQTAENGSFFGVFVFAGYLPETSLFKDKLTLDEDCIVTDESMSVGIPGVFAAGDVRKKSVRQLVTAASDGAIAAISAEKFLAGLSDNA